MTNENKNNPLMSPSTLKNGAVPFNLIKNEHFIPAIQWGIKIAKENIEKIKASTEAPSFENIIVGLEVADEDLHHTSTTFFNLNSANTDEEMQKLAREIGPILSNFSSDVSLDNAIFQRVKAVYDQKDQLNLTEEQLSLLDKTYSGFTRNGALVDDKDKEKLRSIDTRLSELSPSFAENVLNATNDYELQITNEADLEGLPESAIESAKEAALQKGLKNTWLITLDFPSLFPFLTYGNNREIRQQLYMAFNARAFNGKFDNQNNVLEIANLRHQRANVLGYQSHAHFVLEKRMAEAPEKVLRFQEQIAEASKKAAKADVDELQQFIDKLGGPNPLMPWDFSYYSEKLKEEKYQFNEEELRPYFQLENVIDGAFKHANKLFQLEFKKSEEYPTYHEDVSVYEVYDENTTDFIGLLYTDFFPRSSKRGGAWMTAFHEQGLFHGKVIRPHTSIVCNFTKPTSTKPSLLTHNEVRTLFHEFGHALHSLLAQGSYRSVSGTNVYWDFVELPSQIMENWVFEKESLDLFATHYETKKLIPEDLTQKLKESSKFQSGYTSIRQVTFGVLDMSWHNQNPKNISDVSEFENSVKEEFAILPLVPGTNMSCSFSHIFSGGYSAGYYSYKWAEVLDADAFELFKEKGLFHKESALSFKEHILAKGGSEHPMKLYMKFRGREPDADALLRRSGLL